MQFFISFGCYKSLRCNFSKQKLLSKRFALLQLQGMLQTAKDRVLQSPDMDLSAKAKSNFVFHDLTKPWPMPSNSVDLVFGNLVLDHIENLDFFFREAARILRPGGNLFICELHPFKQYLVSLPQLIWYFSLCDPFNGLNWRVDVKKTPLTMYPTVSAWYVE